VVKDAANWLTPAEQDGKQGGITPFQAKGGNHTNLLHIAAIKSTHGQAAPASGSSLGSRQGLSWATPRSAMASMHPEYGEHWNDNRGGESIATQVWREEQWGTPTARDHKSGRGNEDRQYKELTPMMERQQSGKLNPRWVEALMGLPIGWVMPSCTSPQTIEPTSCDSSAMELSQPPQSELSEFSLASCGNWTTPNQMDASIAKPALRPSRIATGRKTDYLARQVSMIQEP
jgi:hypothetical protein